MGLRSDRVMVPSHMVWWFLLAAAAIFLAGFYSQQLFSRLLQFLCSKGSSDIIRALQTLLDALKEYRLNARAGILICVGEELRIVYVDQTLIPWIGRPKHVSDLIVPSMKKQHAQITARYAGRSTPLPDSLNHPLRNVPIMCQNNEIEQTSLIIGKIRFCPMDLFYVVLQPMNRVGSKSPISQLRSSLLRSTSPILLSRSNSMGTADRAGPCGESLRFSRCSSTESNENCGPRPIRAGSSELSWASTRERNKASHIESCCFNDSFSSYESHRSCATEGGTLIAEDTTIVFDDDSAFPDVDSEERTQDLNSIENQYLEDVDLAVYDHIAEVYGIGAASYVTRGLVPAPADYTQATVLYADIVNFSKQCTDRGLKEISSWMTQIHSTIDHLLAKYAIRKVETRGDCCICVSGTNFVSGHGDTRSRDLACDQATRMLMFGTELALALYEIDHTEVRVGMASGSIVLTHISHRSDALPAKYIYGDTVNVACRMEQTGRAGSIQLSESANRLYADEQGTPPAPMQVKDIKGKGPMRASMYDCFRGTFLPQGKLHRAQFAMSAPDLSRL